MRGGSTDLYLEGGVRGGSTDFYLEGGMGGADAGGLGDGVGGAGAPLEERVARHLGEEGEEGATRRKVRETVRGGEGETKRGWRDLKKSDEKAGRGN